MFEIELEELNQVYGVNDKEEMMHLSQEVFNVGNDFMSLGVDRIEKISM